MASGESIASLARKYLGTRYVWGGSSPSGFDCSGLVTYVFGKNGISLPRTTYNQINQGASVEPGKLRPGGPGLLRHRPQEERPGPRGHLHRGRKVRSRPAPRRVGEDLVPC